MTNVLKEAIQEVASLSVSDQEQIGRELLDHIDRLRRLRTDLDQGIASLDAGEGKALDIEDVIRCAREHEQR